MRLLKRLQTECFYRLIRLRRRRSRPLVILTAAVLVWTCLFLWLNLGRPSNGDDVGSLSSEKQVVITQADLDYFAQNVRLNYTVRENTYDNGLLYRARIVLTNTGTRTFPWSEWSIIFCQPYMAEPQHYPYPDGLVISKSGIRLFSINSGVYRMQPLESDSQGILPGQHRDIEFISQYFNIAITDNYPNWYFAVDGLQPRIIESTRGDSFDWVGKYDTPNLWKRTNDPDDTEYDYYDPLTVEQRFDQQGVPDMKRAPLPVIPVPAVVDVYDPSSKINVLDGNWVIVTSSLLANEADYLSDVWGLRVVAQTPGQRYISLIEEEVRVTALGENLPTDESYELEVSPNREVITIKASKPAGAFYGIQTLISIADAQGNVSRTVIRDAPRYEYRGIMLDVARNFQSKERIFRYIDLMAMYKLNKLHLHVTDDEGWRLAIPGLAELTEIGGKRCHDLSETKCLLPFLGSGPFVGPPGSGFYTVEDYRAILRYAALHHIEVIPEIDMPGHSHAAIRAMDARRNNLRARGFNNTEASRFLLQDLQDESEYRSIQGFTSNAMNPCLQSTYTFITRIINTLYAMHRDVNPLKIFHFGGDEVPKGTWEKSPMCQRLKDNGVTISLDQYLAIQISNMTSLYSLDLAGWEDGLYSKREKRPMRRDVFKNENAYSYVWNNVWEWGNAGRAYAFANSGYKVVLTPATNLYFDHPHEPDPEERGLYWASRFTDTFQVYSIFPENIYWNAINKRNGEEIKICQQNDCPQLKSKENIVGLQGTLFGELLRTQQITDYMLLPRLIALADRAWHRTTWESEPDERKRNEGLKSDWTAFCNTLGYKELARLDMMGYKYRIPPPGGKLDGNTLQVSSEFPGLATEISHDGGKTWSEVTSTTTIPSGRQCLLRSRAASGFRYSRSVSIPGDDGNSANDSRRSSYLLVLMMIFIVLHRCCAW